jgi:hypothetical protein
VGLPVLHISTFPPAAKKMEGLASVRVQTGYTGDN